MTDNFNEVIRHLEEIVGGRNIFENEPMKSHTSFRTGGSARLLLTPESADTLISVIKLLRSCDVPFYVIGNGTNLLVRDGGFNGAIIKLCSKMSQISLEGDTITAEAGALLSSVSRRACENGLTGLEFAEGIPGTIGGAVAMNAGAYGGEMKDVVSSVTAINTDGGTVVLQAEELEFGYRSSIISRLGLICLSAVLKMQRGVQSQINEKTEANKRSRIEKQPIDKPSAGSTFKRPEGYFAGKLISDAGLKGCKIGGAAVSEKHAGFIVNENGATASDIISLMEHVQAEVREKFGVTLLPEVKIIGDTKE